MQSVNSGLQLQPGAKLLVPPLLFMISSSEQVLFWSRTHRGSLRNGQNVSAGSPGLIMHSEGMPDNKPPTHFLPHLGFSLWDFHPTVDKTRLWIDSKDCWDYGQSANRECGISSMPLHRASASGTASFPDGKKTSTLWVSQISANGEGFQTKSL